MGKERVEGLDELEKKLWVMAFKINSLLHLIVAGGRVTLLYLNIIIS